MSEDRSKGMYHSPIGKSSLRVGLVMSLLIGLSLLLLAACGGQKSTSAGTASTDGLIVFHRFLDPAQPKITKSAIFTMYPDGSHIRQRAGATPTLRGPPMGRRSPSIAGVTPRIARGAGSWSSTSTPALRAVSHTAYPMRDGLRSTRLHHRGIIALETPNPPSQPTESR